MTSRPRGQQVTAPGEDHIAHLESCASPVHLRRLAGPLVHLLVAWLLITPRGPVLLYPDWVLLFASREECEESATWLHDSARAQGWDQLLPWYVCEEEP